MGPSLYGGEEVFPSLPERGGGGRTKGKFFFFTNIDPRKRRGLFYLTVKGTNAVPAREREGILLRYIRNGKRERS